MAQEATVTQADRALLLERLKTLTNSAEYEEAIRLLDAVDLAVEQDAVILYHAGVCFVGIGSRDRAVDLLVRAARAGFDGFWCAYHLGIIETRYRRSLSGAHYLTVAAALRPDRNDLQTLLERVAPDIDIAWLRIVQAKTKDASAANAALELGMRERQPDAGNFGRAVYYSTLALFLDPEHQDARSQLLTLAPDVFLGLIPGLRPAARLAAPQTGLAPEKHTEFYDLLISSYDQCAEAWKTTLSDDQKNRISKICLIMAARLSFINDDLRHRIFQDAEEFGVHFLPVHFYSPVPSRREVDQAIYQQRYDTLPGLTIDAASHLEWLDRLGRYSNELERFPVDRPNDHGLFYWGNPAFGPGDAAIYYPMIRELKPAKVIEVGAGYSSLIALDALTANGTGSLTCIEPYPMPHLRELAARGKIQLVESRLQDVPLDMFSSLMENDVLFIDSSHVCKIGSDVNHAVFKILPALQAGVFCHFHDIFFPFEFPKHWIENLQLFWNEQYLLMAFLAFNSKFKIEIAGQFIAREMSDAFKARFPHFPSSAAVGGGSLWLSAST